MAFILGPQRDFDVHIAFRNYHHYVGCVRDRLPESAAELATSSWYFNFDDQRCPHDAHLERMTIDEAISGEDGLGRTVSIDVELRRHHYDVLVEYRLHYPKVFAYRLDSFHRGIGERTWRYDEFRLSNDGALLHEIEWAGTGNWIIEASDIEFRCNTVTSKEQKAG
jgi:hypothetical protein